MTRAMKLLTVSGALAFMSACSTVKMPKVDLPGFNEAAADSEELSYPNPNEAPATPENVPSAAEWDDAANAILKRRRQFGAPVSRDDLTDTEILQEIEALKRKVQEYKKDDPVEF